MSAGLVVDGMIAPLRTRITLRAPHRSTTAIIGPAGSGKTCILEAIAGRRSIADATALLDGRPIRARDVGWMPRPAVLLPELTAAENVALGVIGRRRKVSRPAVEQLLDRLLLPPAAWYNLTEQLSGGQQQRVAAATALIAIPDLLCLDEPVNELDAASAEAVWQAIRAAANAGSIAVIATTDEDVAARCDQRFQIS